MSEYGNKVMCQGGQTSVQDQNLIVEDKPGTPITIQWPAQGGKTYPQNINDAFSWKQGSPHPGNAPTRVSDTLLQLDYRMPSSKVKWSYNITLQGCTTQDPDIDNTPPGGDDDKDKDRDKDRERT